MLLTTELDYLYIEIWLIKTAINSKKKQKNSSLNQIIKQENKRKASFSWE